VTKLPVGTVHVIRNTPTAHHPTIEALDLPLCHKPWIARLGNRRASCEPALPALVLLALSTLGCPHELDQPNRLYE
jgi:hypothetical protein